MDRILLRGNTTLLGSVSIYLLALLLFATPWVQRQALFLHAAKWPLWADYSDPVRYGLAPFKTYTFDLTTSDNHTIGAWHVLPDSYYHRYTPYPILPRSPLPPFAQAEALAQRPTVIYMHGNAGSRAAPFRVSLYSALSTRLHVNVVTIDYRGFGENKGKPSEAGLTRDARAAWDWVTKEMRVDPGRVVLMGQSLGTGVVSQLAAELESEGIRPRGIVLAAAFESLEELLSTYTIFKFIPLIRPLRLFPGLEKWYLSHLIDRFDSYKALRGISSPVLLMHAKNDQDIPYSHSVHLFDSLMEPLLPPRPFSEVQEQSMSEGEKADWERNDRERRELRRSLVNEASVPGFATIRSFERTEGKGPVFFLNTLYGGHNLVSAHEGAMDVMGRVMDLGFEDDV
ncbi:alpha/beta-hydrolase [Dacryopinax primogenitus]|uniref:Alpha/beta-hydrolase n=1 Tax=Dacryopinax primogenitus (strain DJM 731) TaxID=1858805 RepID=M5G519_DACPD|nr:alpha/beta-hydrolase [Dacryopinax primogenitus]EJU03320.1 alpha/beta-hydrolase [Dacryopinax primogenitus]